MILTSVIVEIINKNHIGGGVAEILSPKDYKGQTIGFSKFEGYGVEAGQYWEALLEHGHYKTISFRKRLSDMKLIALKEG